MSPQWNTAARRIEAPAYPLPRSLHLNAKMLLSKQNSHQEQEQILPNWQKFQTSEQHDQQAKNQLKKTMLG